MFNKTWCISLIIIILIITITSVASVFVLNVEGDVKDGRYRGVYEDRGVQQISIQFHVFDNILSNLSYRHLYHGGNDYYQMEETHELYPVVVQHQQILDYLDGNPVSSIWHIRNPGDIVDDIDSFSGATIRGAKIFSSLRDGLNRGPYTPTSTIEREVKDYPDGRYRGTFGDRGAQQVSIQFHLQDNIFYDLSYRHLFHDGNDYRLMDETDPLYPVVRQHQQILEHLDGKDLSVLFDLYAPGIFVADIDTFTGATIRGSKILSSIVDGLNRGPYRPTGLFSREMDPYPDGRYRGTFGDRGVQQVSIQFHLLENNIYDLTYRHLFHDGNDYRLMNKTDPLYPVVQQHQQILEYLDGKPLSAVFDLYTPGAFVEDIDTFTGATIRGSKILSAIIDGLNRGLY